MERSDTSGMLIGELARVAGVGVETLRFYEREGLLPEPPRSDSGYRLYGPDAVRRVRFIRRAKDLGFTLSETADLLDLRVTDARNCDDVAERARSKIADVEERLREFSRIKAALNGLVRACAVREETAECPILEALDEGSESRGRGANVGRPEIDLVYFDGCPNADLARKHLRIAVGTVEGEVWREWNLSIEDTPDRFRRFGSPTVLVDGRDVTGEAGSQESHAMACRAEGAPSVALIREALAARE